MPLLIHTIKLIEKPYLLGRSLNKGPENGLMKQIIEKETNKSYGENSILIPRARIPICGNG
jgi:hypothetical protein